MTWTDGYVGIPFVERGRDRSGCDCYGLLRLVLIEQRGIELPPYTEDYASSMDRSGNAGRIAARPLLLGFEHVDPGRVKPFDVLVIRAAGFNCHLALVVDKRQALHTERGKGAILEEFNRPHFRPRIREAWRYAD